MKKIEKTEKAIKAIKKCTKALMKLSYKNYILSDSKVDSISNKNILNMNNNY